MAIKFIYETQKTVQKSIMSIIADVEIVKRVPVGQGHIVNTDLGIILCGIDLREFKGGRTTTTRENRVNGLPLCKDCQTAWASTSQDRGARRLRAWIDKKPWTSADI